MRRLGVHLHDLLDRNIDVAVDNPLNVTIDKHLHAIKNTSRVRSGTCQDDQRGRSQADACHETLSGEGACGQECIARSQNKDAQMYTYGHAYTQSCTNAHMLADAHIHTHKHALRQQA